jgi:hypothetical protein
LLKPTPTIPQRPLIANGIESTSATITATGSPSRSMAAPGRRGCHQSTSAAAMTSATSPSVALVAWPGARARKPVTVSTAPKPTAGASHLRDSSPSARPRTARPTSSEAAQISAAEA